MLEEVKRLAGLGGKTIVGVTSSEFSSGAAPDPAGSVSGKEGPGYSEDGSRASANLDALQELRSEASINVAVCTEHYRDPYLDVDWFARHSIVMVVELLVRDMKEGTAGTEIRTEIIGAGADKWVISAVEERSFRAAARAQHPTALSIATHVARWPVGLAELDILTPKE